MKWIYINKFEIYTSLCFLIIVTMNNIKIMNFHTKKQLKANHKKLKHYEHCWDNSAPIWHPVAKLKNQFNQMNSKARKYTVWADIPEKARRRLANKIEQYINCSKVRNQTLNSLLKAQYSNGYPYKQLKEQWEVIANVPIKKFTLLGHYAGIIHNFDTYEKTNFLWKLKTSMPFHYPTT